MLKRIYTKEQNRRRNSTEASVLRKKKWLERQGPGYRSSLHRLKRYGITKDQYHQMLDSQGYCCKICLTKFGRACIDHNHKTGEVRGLLCQKCNTAFGLALESEFILYRLLAYLKHTEVVGTSEWSNCKFADLPRKRKPKNDTPS
jgi:hypothetical protein